MRQLLDLLQGKVARRLTKVARRYLADRVDEWYDPDDEQAARDHCLPTHPPPIAPARLDPQIDLTLDEHPPDDAYLDEPPEEHGQLASSRAPP